MDARHYTSQAISVLTESLQDGIGLEDLLFNPSAHSRGHRTQVLEDELCALGLSSPGLAGDDATLVLNLVPENKHVYSFKWKAQHKFKSISISWQWTFGHGLVTYLPAVCRALRADSATANTCGSSSANFLLRYRRTASCNTWKLVRIEGINCSKGSTGVM